MLLLPGELNTKFLAHKNGTFERGISTQSLVALFQANFFQRSKKKKKLSKCSLLTLTLSTKSVVTFCFPLTTYIDGRQKEKKDKT